MFLTEKQQNYLREIAAHLGANVVQEVIPGFRPEETDQVSLKEFKLVVDNAKRYLKIGDLYREKLQDHRQTIEERFQKNLEDLTVDDLERVIFQFPHLNLPYVIKHFHIKPKDRPLVYTSEYEYGIQQSPHCYQQELFYLKFYNLLTVDYDDLVLDQVERRLQDFCQAMPSFLFALYETYRGFHLMLLSHAIPYHEDQALQLMEGLGCDSWYSVFSHKNGFRLRLSPKIRPDGPEPHVARFLGLRGQGRPHPDCARLHRIYRSYLTQETLDRSVSLSGGFYDQFVTEVLHPPLENPTTSLTSQELLEQSRLKEVTPELVLEASASLLRPLKKPQQLLENHSDYYLAIDQYTRTVYVCFRELMMIDLDGQKLSETITDINDYLAKKLPEEDCAVEIYQSLHGYHLFLIDRKRNHRDVSGILEMNRLGCDFFYSIYSYQRGYSVRLNRKNYHQDLDRSRDLYQYRGFYGNRTLIDSDLQGHVKLHFALMKKYQNFLVNQMK
jgi:hypothetical protein